MHKSMVITMPDGSKWGVPVAVIAKDRAFYYKDEFGGQVNRSLKEDTEPLFADSEDEIADWASNNMNWSDVAAHAFLVQAAPPVDFEEGWANGEKEYLD